MDMLPILYARIAEITRPLCALGLLECAQFQGRKYRCCERKHCEAAALFALNSYGITLLPTGNPEVPFMGENGCTVEPHLRPKCSMHLCSVTFAAHASIAGDPVRTAEFIQLQNEIQAEARRQGKAA